MPRGNPRGNKQNLTHKLTVEEARKGGKNSVESRKKKKTIRDILSAFLEQPAKDIPAFRNIAGKLGLKDDEEIKQVMSVMLLMNSAKKGDLGDLQKLAQLLGEDRQQEESDVLKKLDDVIGEIDVIANK